MSNYTLKNIVNKLNDFCARSLQAGVEFAVTRQHYEVTIEHVLLKILETGDCDLSYAMHLYKIDQDQLWQNLLANLAAQSAGNQGKPGFSPQLFKWLEQALLANSLHYQQDKIRSIALLDALLQMAPQLPGHIDEILQTLSTPVLQKNFVTITERSIENKNYQAPSIDVTQAATSGDTALSQFTHDVTAKAEAGKIDPVIGRELEIRLMVDVLMRRRKNNPILVGEPGVGKTAIVEGLALKMIQGDVPPSLQKVRLHTLDLGLLQAGAGVKGEFEKRLHNVIEEVKNSSTPIILFIDEAHTLIGAGAESGSGDAANLLKPALARGELRTIAATTWAEYKQYFERDAALDRRFQQVKVEEPSEEQAIQIMSGLKDIYQKHHGVLITDAAIAAAVNLSHRYITGRQLPDKAIDLIDTAAARVTLSSDVMPSELDDLQAKKTYLTKRLADIKRDQENGIFSEESNSKQNLFAQLEQTEEQLNMLHQQWLEEKKLVAEIKQQRETIGIILRAKIVDKAKFAWLQAAIRETQAELAALQKKRPLVQAELNADVIAEVVADLTGVPVNNLLKDDVEKLLDLEQALSEKVIGQSVAIKAIAEAIRTRRVGLGNPNAPLGIFMLTGPSGVGKTETARIVAKQLFGGDSFLTTINMSEYQEAHTVSQLKGSPPGYVGYGEGGVLTEAVRKKPYSVILLDEVEKAHKDVLNMFYQVFDQGKLRDGEGREINFRNTVIFMTSNLGTETILQACTEQGETEFDYANLKTTINTELSHYFAPAFIARMQIYPYIPLTPNALESIVALKLDALAERLLLAQNLQLRCDAKTLRYLAESAISPDRGARAINNIIEQQIEPIIARNILNFMAEDTMPEFVTLSIDENNELNLAYSSQLEQQSANSKCVTN